MREIKLVRAVNMRTYQPSIKILADGELVHRFLLETIVDDRAKLGTEKTDALIVRTLIESGLSMQEAKRVISLWKAGVFTSEI